MLCDKPNKQSYKYCRYVVKAGRNCKIFKCYGHGPQEGRYSKANLGHVT